MLELLLGALLVCAPPPTQDFDQDGLVDTEDDCPTDPGNVKNKGCPGEAPPPPPPAPTEPTPEIRVDGNKLSIDEKVRFRSGSASVDPRSFDLLARVAAAIKQIPAKRIAIEGHTDNRGGRRLNTRLSERRAQAVVAHLVRHGVDRKRLDAKGFGPSQPIADNRTKKGRATNRRVEFIIVD